MIDVCSSSGLKMYTQFVGDVYFIPLPEILFVSQLTPHLEGSS